MANKSVTANSPKGPSPTKGNVGSHAAKKEMELADVGAAKSAKATEMELANLMNSDLTTWKTQDMKGVSVYTNIQQAIGFKLYSV